MAEKMVKIMEERLKEKAGVTDKLLSKNHALKVVHKLQVLLAQAACLGSLLY